MTERIARINDRTWLSLGLVITLGGLIWFAGVDRTSAWAEINATKAAVTEIKEELRSTNEKLSYQTQALIRLETKLGTRPTGTPN